MALIQSGAGTDLWTIDPTSKAGRVTLYDANGNALASDLDKHLSVNIRPPGFDSLGCYRVAAATGAVAATLAAGSTLFSMRWTDSTRIALIQAIRVSAVVSSAITAAVNFDLDCTFVRSFTASDSGGTALNLTSNNNKLRTNMGSSLVADMRIATTAALTVGTRTLDAQAFSRVSGSTGTALGTQFFGSGNGPIPLYLRDNPDEHPIILAQNEGLVIRNVATGPATGTFTVLVMIEWIETSSY